LRKRARISQVRQRNAGVTQPDHAPERRDGGERGGVPGARAETEERRGGRVLTPCPSTALLPHPGTVAAFPLFTLTPPAAASPIDKEGSRHCHRPSAVRQCASYLVRLSARITKRNQCTVQVIACPKDALIHLSTCREFPSGPQAIDCNRRLLQHDDGGSFVTAGMPHGGGSLRGSTRCRHLDP